MPELTKVEPVKKAGFVDHKYNRSKARQNKIEQEEKELEEFIKQSGNPENHGDNGSGEPNGGTEETKETSEGKQQKEENEHSSSEKKEEKLSPEEESFKKRYGDLRRHMQRKEKEWEERISNLSEKKVDLPASEEDIKQWQEKYPQVAKVIETIAQKKADAMFEKAEGKMKEFQDFAYEAERTKAMAEIRKVHEDFDDIKESNEFHDWADEQPKWVQDAIYENEDDARSVIRVLDLYKVDKGMTKTDKKQKEKQAASQVGTRQARTKVDANESGGKIYESQVNKMSNDEFEKNLDKINEAMRSGNFVYDMTGGAR